MMVLTDECVVKAEYILNSVKSYLHQVKLSQKKDMSQTPEKRLVEALKECLNVDEKRTKQFIAMTESYFDDSLDNYNVQ